MTVHRMGIPEADIARGSERIRPARVVKVTGGASSCALVSDEKWEKAFGRRPRFADVEPTKATPPVFAEGAFGAHQNGRQAIDRMTGHLVREGLFRPGDIHADEARAIAQSAAHRKDDRLLGTPDAESVARHHTPLPGASPTAPKE